MKFLLAIVFVFSVYPNSIYAQSELDKFKTEEELAKEKQETGWYDSTLKEIKHNFNELYAYVSSFFVENTAELKKSINESNVFENAEAAVKERNTAADTRAKFLQEKTGFKGESKNMQDVVDNKELTYEVKDLHEVQNDLKK